MDPISAGMAWAFKRAAVGAAQAAGVQAAGPIAEKLVAVLKESPFGNSTMEAVCSMCEKLAEQAPQSLS